MSKKNKKNLKLNLGFIFLKLLYKDKYIFQQLFESNNLIFLSNLNIILKIC